MRPGSYEEWVRLYDTITPAARAAYSAEQRRLREQPLISILLPVYNPEIAWLAEAIQSVRAQTYSRWELCIADDASTAPGVRDFLKEQAKSDTCIRLVFRPTNGHISACSNSALALATGELCGLLDQDDLLAEHALSFVAREVNKHPEVGLIYSDEDFLDANGARTNPFFKPDWNPELFLGQNYLNHLSVYRTEVLREIGGFRQGYEGSQDYDLALRTIERLHRGQIRHIPRVLYHWRMVPGSLAALRDAKPYAKDAARRALADHVRRRGLAAEVQPCPENVESHRVTFAVPQPAPLISVILYGSDAAAVAAELLTRSGYKPCEFLAADASESNFGKQINLAVSRATGSILVLLCADLKIDEPHWLQELIGQAARPEVGAVGVRIWWPDGTLQHGGYLLGVGGIAAHAHAGVPRGHAGYFNRTFLQRNCAAVSGSCLALRTSVFRELGGLDEANLVSAFQDVDLCLRLRARGLGIVWTPSVNATDHGEKQPEAASEADAAYMRHRWPAELPNDPFYSPNLSLEEPAFELAFPPRW